MKKYLWILLAVCVICIGALAISSFAGSDVAVYLDQTNGSDDATGAVDAPVKTMEKAFALLPEGGTIYVVGTYTYNEYDAKAVVSFPETNGKVLITSADKEAVSAIAFECNNKTTVQFKSPVEFDYINWTYNHTKVGSGKAGAMDIYSGPSASFGENFNFICINDACPGKPIHENCVAIRGGWFSEEHRGTIYSGSDISITVLGGKWAYINGGHASGAVAVGNSEITIGGNTEIYQRLQLAGSNGGDVAGNVVVNITGGKIGSGGSETNATTLSDYGLFLIGHAKEANAAEIAGNVTVNISGGEINVIKTARTQWESIKGDLTINVKGDAKIGAVTLDTTKFDLEKTQKLNIQVKDMGAEKFADTNGSVEFWDDVRTLLTEVYLDQANGSNDATGKKDAPVKSMEQAFELLPYGGTIYVVGTYTYNEYDAKAVVSFPETNGKVLITSADKEAVSAIAFECNNKTTVQFKSPVEFDYINWTYNHTKVGSGKAGAMDIYSGPSASFGENFNFICINDACPGKPIHENCVAIRGGWFSEEHRGTIYSGSDISITVLGGKWAYINGGHASGAVAVGNSEITIGGNTEIYQRLQLAGSNGGDVAGNVVVNITGGKIGSGGSETNATTLSDYGLFLIGHAKEANAAEIAGNVTVNISGGEINVIKTARTQWESIKGDLTINISGDAQIKNVNIDPKHFDVDNKSQILNIEIKGMTAEGYGEFWDEIKIVEDKPVDPEKPNDDPEKPNDGPETGDFGLIALAFVAISSVVVKKRKDN